MTAAFTLAFPEPDVALLTFDAPGKSVNILSRAALAELAALLDGLEARTDLAGVILRSGKPGSFIAGADLHEFVASLAAPAAEVVALCRQGQNLFRRFSRLPAVSVAAVDGACLGGGAELACWCDRRVLSRGPKTEIGFPEVKIGLFPGWGGTVRAARLVGMGNAVELITTGESVDAAAALALGLADDLASADDLLGAAIRLVRMEGRTGQHQRDRAARRGPVNFPETELGFLGLTASALIQRETRGQYPAPPAALEALLEGALLDEEAALQREAEGLASLFGGPVNAALLNLFFLTDRNKKDRGVARGDAAAREAAQVGVVGAGIMGAGIAAAHLKRDVPVALVDSLPAALAKGARGAIEEAAYDKKTKAPDPARALELAAKLRQGASEGDLAGRDLVIEAIVENLDAKRQLLGRVEALLGPEAILASNTSTIPITRLAEPLKRPDRFCGMHFFNPVRRMRLVEVIRGRQTSDETVATVVAHAKKLGKSPIVVNDGPGFIVNRVLFPYLNEALALFSEGAEIKHIEKAATAFGMPMGPLELFDMVGLDTAIYAGRVMWEAYPDRAVLSPIVPALFKAGRLGQKNGLGFFNYQNKKRRPEPDPAVDALLEPYRKTRTKFTPEQLTHRLFLPMLLEATRALAENIARDPRDIDLGVVLGLGFPPFRGGLMYWADALGAKNIVESLKPWQGLGARWQPTPMLLELAQRGGRFYGK